MGGPWQAKGLAAAGSLGGPATAEPGRGEGGVPSWERSVLRALRWEVWKPGNNWVITSL